MTTTTTPQSTPNPLHPWCCLAYWLFGLAFFTHFAMLMVAAIDVLEALKLPDGDVFATPREANLRIGTTIGVAASQARDTAFLLLGWIAAFWMDRNARLSERERA